LPRSRLRLAHSVTQVPAGRYFAQVENSVITNKCSRIGRQSRAPRAIVNTIPRILESSNEKKNDDSRVTPARADRTE